MVNTQEQHWRDLDKLILVAGHAIYIADDFQNPASDTSWFLQSFQKGEPPFYIEHILCGVEIAAVERNSLLVFSGGQTRFEAGLRSEAQSYWLLANHFAWWQRPSVRLRTATEEFARDSFENLLFGICRFHECTKRWPDAIEVISWAFKKTRFEKHRDAINWPASKFKFTGVNNPLDLDGAIKGEKIAHDDFDNDPFATEDKLYNKRLERDPFHRNHPYSASCKNDFVASLLNHKSSDKDKAFIEKLPWRNA